MIHEKIDREAMLQSDYPTRSIDRMLQSRYIVGMRVDATSYEDAAIRVARWARSGESRYVCIASVNNVMEAYDDAEFRSIMNDADLVTPDGMPLVWGLRRLGVAHATRVYGPDLTPVLLTKASEEGIPVGFYGGSPAVLEAFLHRVEHDWPGLRVTYAWSPPFRDLTDEEDRRVVEEINSAGTRMLFVGIGCPRQEIWMSHHRGRVDAVMLGVGAAFDFLAGVKKQAPSVMQRTGTEWVFRFVTEPRRLWRRYLKHNPRFAVLLGAQLLREARRDKPPTSRRNYEREEME
jgi:N-acetylglucosaminyldiphosphoundecaprenol N-acetyl-beta-D-mannosaminyltransferase